jgi:hypothetical protein
MVRCLQGTETSKVYSLFYIHWREENQTTKSAPVRSASRKQTANEFLYLASLVPEWSHKIKNSELVHADVVIATQN